MYVQEGATLVIIHSDIEFFFDFMRLWFPWESSSEMIASSGWICSSLVHFKIVFFISSYVCLWFCVCICVYAHSNVCVAVVFNAGGWKSSCVVRCSLFIWRERVIFLEASHLQLLELIFFRFAENFRFLLGEMVLGSHCKWNTFIPSFRLSPKVCHPWQLYFFASQATA